MKRFVSMGWRLIVAMLGVGPLVWSAQPPTVSACTPAANPCPALSIPQGASVALNGQAVSNSPNPVTAVWSLAGGSAAAGYGAVIATFLSSTSPVTTATFSDPGVYTLQLVANDGVTSSTSTVTVTVTQTQTCSTTLYPGDDIELAVACNPPGTTFTLKPGLYRLQSIAPQTGDIFLGEPGAILSGAQLVTNFSQEGSLWVASGPAYPGQTAGDCDSLHPACMYPEDLYFDNQPLLRVLSSTSVVSGACYFDYAHAKIYFADNPAGHTVEVSAARTAFEGQPPPSYTSIAHVTIKNLIVEKYAIPAQMGAIGDQYPGAGWLIQNNETRFNHGAGINAGSQSQVIGNYSHHNGEKGLGAGGTGPILVDSNELSFNNYAGFDCGWECGGAKFAQANGLTVTHNYVHDNLGDGLWDDVNSINVVYDSNTVINNLINGISHEIGYNAAITHNFVEGNGIGSALYPAVWLWNAQILIQNSQNVEVASNTIEIPGNCGSSNGCGNGISLIEQSRGAGAYGPWITQNNWIHDNNITHLQNGADGAVEDDGNTAVFVTNTFDSDHYHVLNVSNDYWDWLNGPTLYFDWPTFQAAGQELHGTIDTNISGAALTPTVTLTNPANNSVYISTAAVIALAATAAEPGGQIIKVDFYENGYRLAASTAAPYGFTWTDAPAGNYLITADAVDMQGTMVVSTPVTVIVNSPSTTIPAPFLSLPSNVPVGSLISVTYPSGYSIDYFVWTFTPRTAGNARSAASRELELSSSAGVEFNTPGVQANLGQESLQPGTYQISVVAVNSAGVQSPPATATVTLVEPNTSAVRVYPNPFRPDRGDTAITFDQLPADCTVKIFTVSARLVRTLSAPSGSVSWDLTNESGEKVASGIYLYLVTDSQGQKTHGKLAVIF